MKAQCLGSMLSPYCLFTNYPEKHFLTMFIGTCTKGSFQPHYISVVHLKHLPQDWSRVLNEVNILLSLVSTFDRWLTCRVWWMSRTHLYHHLVSSFLGTTKKNIHFVLQMNLRGCPVSTVRNRNWTIKLEMSTKICDQPNWLVLPTLTWI